MLLLWVQGGTVELFGLVVHIGCSVRRWMLNLGRARAFPRRKPGMPGYPSALP